MNSPLPSQRRIVPPVLPPVDGRRPIAYTPRKFVPPRMDPFKRNLIVWGICAILIAGAVLTFANWMLPAEMRRLLDL